MHSFTDAKGKEWNLSLTLAAAERIDQADLSLLTQADTSFLEPGEEMFNLLVRDTSVIFACIWCIILPEAEREGIDQEEFKDRISPQVIPLAKRAFWDELRDFFPEMGIALSKAISAREKLLTKFAETMEEMQGDIDAMVDRTLEEGMEETRKLLRSE